MLFTVLGDPDRAIDCFHKAVQVYQAANLSMTLRFSTVIFELGILLSQRSEYHASADCFCIALEIKKSLLGDTYVVARTHYSLGVTIAYQKSNRNEDFSSTSHFKEALRICEQEFKAAHVQSSIIIHALGVLNERKGDSLSASFWFAKEFSMRKLLFGKNDKSLASVCVALGSCYYNSCKYDLAISAYEEGLRVISLGENVVVHEIADISYKIASCHDSLCNYDEAIARFDNVKRLRESIFGALSTPVMQTMLRMGYTLLSTGKFDKSLDCFNNVLGIGCNSNSINAIEVSNALYGKGCAQFCGFHLADAMKSFCESLNWKLAVLGENSPGLACIFYQMAHVYLEQSEHEEGITCFEEYARLQKLEPQRNLHDYADICYAEGIVAKLRGRKDAALSFYNQALAMFDTLFGGDHERVASIHVSHLILRFGCIPSLPSFIFFFIYSLRLGAFSRR
jgi:tetratricopeptide (TPR) repeat protein